MDATVKTVLISAFVGAVVSIATDRVRASTAGRWWVAQERWKLKRDIYIRLLDSLWELSDAAQQYATIQTLEGPEVKGYEARLAKHWDRSRRAFEDIEKGRGSLPLLLHSRTLSALDDLQKADEIGCPAPYLDALKSVYADVLLTAEKDLKLRLH